MALCYKTFKINNFIKIIKNYRFDVLIEAGSHCIALSWPGTRSVDQSWPPAHRESPASAGNKGQCHHSQQFPCFRAKPPTWTFTMAVDHLQKRVNCSSWRKSPKPLPQPGASAECLYSLRADSTAMTLRRGLHKMDHHRAMNLISTA